jgi:hypothetical protein
MRSRCTLLYHRNICAPSAQHFSLTHRRKHHCISHSHTARRKHAMGGWHLTCLLVDISNHRPAKVASSAVLVLMRPEMVMMLESPWMSASRQCCIRSTTLVSTSCTVASPLPNPRVARHTARTTIASDTPVRAPCCVCVWGGGATTSVPCA